MSYPSPYRSQGCRSFSSHSQQFVSAATRLPPIHSDPKLSPALKFSYCNQHVLTGSLVRQAASTRRVNQSEPSALLTNVVCEGADRQRGEHDFPLSIRGERTFLRVAAVVALACYGQGGSLKCASKLEQIWRRGGDPLHRLGSTAAFHSCNVLCLGRGRPQPALCFERGHPTRARRAAGCEVRHVSQCASARLRGEHFPRPREVLAGAGAPGNPRGSDAARELTGAAALSLRAARRGPRSTPRGSARRSSPRCRCGTR